MDSRQFLATLDEAMPPSPSLSQFRYGFANAIPEQEARELYDRWTMDGVK